MNTNQYNLMADGKIHNETNGKVSKSSKVKQAKDLEEVLGMREINPFRTTNAETFEESLKSMSLTDLRELAVKSGVFPSGNKASLKNKLRKEFSFRANGGHTAGYAGEQYYDQAINDKIKNLSSGDSV